VPLLECFCAMGVWILSIHGGAQSRIVPRQKFIFQLAPEIPGSEASTNEKVGIDPGRANCAKQVQPVRSPSSTL